MKVILSGYEGSKHLLGVSSRLAVKYLPVSMFDIIYLNYGKSPIMQEGARYHSLGDVQNGVESWAKDIRTYLQSISDEIVIFALDDYLLSEKIRLSSYHAMLNMVECTKDIACARLCQSDEFKPSEYAHFSGLIVLNQDTRYTVTTQYCLWKKHVLEDVLDHVNTPWEFEIAGTAYYNSRGFYTIGDLEEYPLKYDVHSALSKRWQDKVNLGGLSSSDEKEIKELLHV